MQCINNACHIACLRNCAFSFVWRIALIHFRECSHAMLCYGFFKSFDQLFYIRQSASAMNIQIGFSKKL